ncbi:MAG: BadF/BadG/BcrA/BcrD ATPase family protein [Candidatus Spechtbacterales bacterium]
MKYILGVDAGSTKTAAAVADESGKILGRGVGGAGNIHNADCAKNLNEATEAALKNAGVERVDFASACFGIAGTDTEKSLEKAKQLASQIISAKNLLVVNDIMLVRPACSDKKYGISVIAGTGSNFYGIDSHGNEERVGGLDYLLSDEGGAYRIGQKGMSAAAKSYDGRGEKTSIEGLIIGKFKVNTIRDFADMVYSENFGKDEVAEVALLVDIAYRQGDAVAEKILSEAAGEIALAINTLIKKLDLQNDDWDIVAAGGEFRSPFPFEEKIKEQLTDGKDRFKVCVADPVEGAVKLALKEL